MLYRGVAYWKQIKQILGRHKQAHLSSNVFTATTDIPANVLGCIRYRSYIAHALNGRGSAMYAACIRHTQ